MTRALSPLAFPGGPELQNRLVLAPLTNGQSQENGELGEDELRWMSMRARGGYGMLFTCASHVQENGKAYSGQLGIWADRHVPGLTRLARAMKAEGGVAIAQLHHGGMRALKEWFDGDLVCASDNPRTGARALTAAEVAQCIEAFIAAARRAEAAGFDGVELHAAHGYLLQEFFSPSINRRTDRYGGDLQARYRILFEILDGVRARCRPGFLVGVRLSPERFGMLLSETLEVAERLMREGWVDFLDMSLWDVFKKPEQPGFGATPLIVHCTRLNRGRALLGVAGKIYTPEDAERALGAGADWVMLGRAAILNHDFPKRHAADPGYRPVQMPTTVRHLRGQGLSDRFIDRMKVTWPDFFEPEEVG